MTQLPLPLRRAPVSLDVYLICPACAYTWWAAVIQIGAWWAEGVTPEKTAQRPYCPSCNEKPPMGVSPQTRERWGAVTRRTAA